MKNIGTQTTVQEDEKLLTEEPNTQGVAVVQPPGGQERAEPGNTEGGLTTGISGLNRMIVEAPFGTAIAIYAGIEISRSNPKLGARIQAFVRGSLLEFFEELNPRRKHDNKVTFEIEVKDTAALLNEKKIIDYLIAANPAGFTLIFKEKVAAAFVANVIESLAFFCGEK